MGFLKTKIENDINILYKFSHFPKATCAHQAKHSLYTELPIGVNLGRAGHCRATMKEKKEI